MVFPGVETETWTYSEEAGAWYHHRFYQQEPDLDTSNPEVRAEIRRIVAFWARLGVSGFRIDAAPFLLERVEAGQEIGRPDYDLLKELREDVSWHRGDSVFLAEANVADDQIHHFFGRGEGMASRLQMLFAFRLNQALMLGLARRDATPVREALTTLPELPRHGQWATFLRGHDEVDLGGLAPDERADVMAAFGPDAGHQLYERGIRRRFAPMLDGDQRRIEMAYSLQFTMPGTPVLRYGDELGMGDDLALTERESVRTPMQWSDTENGGFSGAEPGELLRPVVADGPFGFHEVNVTDQRRDPESLLSWFERMIHTLRECEEVGLGAHRTIPVCEPAVLAHVAEAPSGAILFLHNLGDQPVTVELPDPPDGDGEPVEMLDDGPYDEVDMKRMSLRPYGYRWIRLRRTHAYT
jgi:maltose alpha-D-glucosyltransferase/alpha-amylase